MDNRQTQTQTYSDVIHRHSLLTRKNMQQSSSMSSFGNWGKGRECTFSSRKNMFMAPASEMVALSGFMPRGRLYSTWQHDNCEGQLSGLGRGSPPCQISRVCPFLHAWFRGASLKLQSLGRQHLQPCGMTDGTPTPRRNGSPRPVCLEQDFSPDAAAQRPLVH